MIDVPCVFVLGVPRSGNTLVASLLNRSNSVRFFDDTLVRKLLRVVLNFDFTSNDNNSVELLDKLRQDDRINEVLALANFKTENLPDIKELLNLLFKRLLKNNNVLYFGDKAPNMLRYMPELLSLFPAAKIVFVVRDPRDNVYSLINRQYLSLAQSCQLYDEYNREVVRFLNLLGSEKAVLIRFEDVLAQPESSIHSLFDFIDIPFDLNVLDLSEYGEKQDSYVLPKLDKSKIGRWKENMRAKDVRFVERFLNSHFTEHKYDIFNINIKPSRLSFLRVLLDGFIWDVKGLFKTTQVEMRSKKLISAHIPFRIRLKRLLYNLIHLSIANKFKPKL